MSLTEDLLVVLTDYHGGYRLMRARMHGYTGPARQGRRPASFFEASGNTLRVTFSRLKKRGLVQNKSSEWKITERGRAYLDKIRSKFKLPVHVSKKISPKPKNMIVVFDIPEAQKRKRAWLRTELSNLEFAMLQKSVWFGPTPLPKRFLKSLNQLRLIPYLKFFKAEESDIV